MILYYAGNAGKKEISNYKSLAQNHFLIPNGAPPTGVGAATTSPQQNPAYIWRDNHFVFISTQEYGAFCEGSKYLYADIAAITERNV